MIKLLSAVIVLAHMNYPSSCCSDRDCKPVPCEQLTAIPGGGILDEVTRLTFRAPMVMPSRDDQCHLCINSGKPICAFVLQGS